MILLMIMRENACNSNAPLWNYDHSRPAHFEAQTFSAWERLERVSLASDIYFTHDCHGPLLA